MPSLWAAQGLFLPAVLIVCGASFTLERFFIVNLGTWVAGVALIAIVVAAPIHAIQRNSVSPNDRTYYRLVALELTKRWHQATEQPMTQVSGDDGLAFATAFYSPDHPRYSRPFQFQYSWGMPRPATLARGWIGVCFVTDASCMDWMGKVAAVDRRSFRTSFEVRPTLWGTPGIPTSVAALMVLPRDAEIREPGDLRSDAAEEFSSSRRRPAQ
jgi:hypothetical protein